MGGGQLRAQPVELPAITWGREGPLVEVAVKVEVRVVDPKGASLAPQRHRPLGRSHHQPEARLHSSPYLLQGHRVAAAAVIQHHHLERVQGRTRPLQMEKDGVTASHALHQALEVLA